MTAKATRCTMLVVVVALTSMARAADSLVDVGGVSISVPAPEGFIAVTEAMQPYYDFEQHLVPDENQQFISFVSAADAAQITAGTVPNISRRLYLQSARQLIPLTLGRADFADLQNEIKTQNDTILQDVEKKLPGLVEKMNRGFSADYAVDPGLTIGQMVPFPPHHETDRALGYSMLFAVGARNQAGQDETRQVAVTCTFLHLRSKVVFVYCNGPKEDLEWTRTASRAWVDDLIAANPPTPEQAAREAQPRTRGFQWGEIGEKALVGALVGAIVGALLMVFRRKRPPALPEA